MTENPYKTPVHHDEPLPSTEVDIDHERSILIDMIYGAAIGLYYMFTVSAAFGVIVVLVASVFRWIWSISD